MSHRILNWLLPQRCCHCGRPPPPAQPLCERCDELRAGSAVLEWGARNGIASAWSAHIYEGPARSLVRAFKHRGGAALAGLLADQVVRRVPAAAWRDAVLVAVPSHPVSAARRGYAPSELLATEVARRLGLPMCMVVARSATYRPQSAGNRRARLELPATAFALRAPRTRNARKMPHFPTNVVLCDDVRTTGVTLELCASQLSGLFTGEIRAVTFASALQSQQIPLHSR